MNDQVSDNNGANGSNNTGAPVQTERIFCGNGKEIQTSIGSLIKIGISPDDLQKINNYAAQKAQNGENGWVNLALKKRREVSPSGSTHFLEIDTWKPGDRSNNGQSAQNTAPAQNNAADVKGEEVTADDLPF